MLDHMLGIFFSAALNGACRNRHKAPALRYLAKVSCAAQAPGRTWRFPLRLALHAVLHGPYTPF